MHRLVGPTGFQAVILGCPVLLAPGVVGAVFFLMLCELCLCAFDALRFCMFDHVGKCLLLIMPAAHILP